MGRSLAVWLTLVGWVAVVYASIVQDGGPTHLDAYAWATFLVLFAAAATVKSTNYVKDLSTRRMALAICIAFCLIRAGLFAIENRWGGFGVWVAIIGLLLQIHGLRIDLEVERASTHTHGR